MEVNCPLVGVTGAGAAWILLACTVRRHRWEQRKLEARKIPESAARREAAVPSVQCTLCSAAFRRWHSLSWFIYLPSIGVNIYSEIRIVTQPVMNIPSPIIETKWMGKQIVFGIWHEINIYSTAFFLNCFASFHVDQLTRPALLHKT
jgi:hypothetical protein